jgi:hypothetical protein
MSWPTFLFGNLQVDQETHVADINHHVEDSNQSHRRRYGFWKDLSGSVNFTKDLHIVSDHDQPANDGLS